jgi:hypothetical protein
MTETVIYLHAISPFGECCDDKSLVIIAPSPHLLIQIDDGTDIVDDVLGLSTLIVEGDMESCQGLEGSSNINFRATSDTYMYIGKVEVNKILNKIKDLFSWSWHARIVWTLVESIDDKVNRALSWE